MTQDDGQKIGQGVRSDRAYFVFALSHALGFEVQMIILGLFFGWNGYVPLMMAIVLLPMYILLFPLAVVHFFAAKYMGNVFYTYMASCAVFLFCANYILYFWRPLEISEFASKYSMVSLIISTVFPLAAAALLWIWPARRDHGGGRV